jgi:filamentous hemagglutinin
MGTAKNFQKSTDGYYKEYVVPTLNIRRVGPQRLVMGQGGKIYYSPDHYESFVRIK